MADTAPTVHERDDAEIEFSRVVAFSDGVFAIAITLLVLALEVPAGGDLADELADRGEEFLAYAISFAVLGRLWLAHHRFFGTLARFDGRLVAINLFYLAWVALVPFTSELLGNYSGDSLGVAIYAFNLTAISLTFVWQIRYAFRVGLIREDAREYERRFAGRANYAMSAIFGLSIPVAFLSPLAAILLWTAMFFVGRRLGDRLAGKRAPT